MEAMRLFDTHCHLNDAEAFPEPDAAVREAREHGVERMVVVGVDQAWNRLAVDVAERFEGVFAAVGWHPNSARSFGDAESADLRAWLAHPTVVALGEIGLDYHWHEATPDEQERCLLAQLDLADELGKPVVFHCREAWPELLAILRRREPGRWLFHCFSGTMEHARAAAEMGGWFGFDGPITYPKAEETRAILREVPRDRFVLETDSPWLAPVPYRGKPNRPAYLAHVNAKAAEVLGLSEEECADVAWRNACAFFGLVG